MLDVNSHYKLQRLPSPMELLQATCEKLTAIWPLLRLCVLTAGNIHEEITEIKTIIGDSAVIDGLPKQYFDIFTACMKDEKPYFAGSDLPENSNVLAVLPCLLLTVNGDETTGAAGQQSDGISAIQRGAFGLFSSGSKMQELDEKDLAMLIILIDQFTLYNRLYGIIAGYNQRARQLRHDLRTPLTSVSMIGGLLQQEEQNAELREIGDMLHSASEKMDGLLKAFRPGAKS